MSEAVKTGLPSWVLILVFVAILVILAVFGDLFTFILGTLLEIIVFAVGYNSTHAEH